MTHWSAVFQGPEWTWFCNYKLYWSSCSVECKISISFSPTASVIYSKLCIKYEDAQSTKKPIFMNCAFKQAVRTPLRQWCHNYTVTAPSHIHMAAIFLWHDAQCGHMEIRQIVLISLLSGWSVTEKINGWWKPKDIRPYLRKYNLFDNRLAFMRQQLTLAFNHSLLTLLFGSVTGYNRKGAHSFLNINAHLGNIYGNVSQEVVGFLW